MARLKETYRKDVVPALVKQFEYQSIMEVPRIEKIVLNMGVGEATSDKKLLDNAVGDMQKVSGQKPVITKARKAIGNFKIRQGRIVTRGTEWYVMRGGRIAEVRAYFLADSGGDSELAGFPYAQRGNPATGA